LHGLGRRKFLRAAAANWTTLPMAGEALTAEAASAPTPSKAGKTRRVALRVNNQVQTLSLDPRTTLLDALREAYRIKQGQDFCAARGLRLIEAFVRPSRMIAAPSFSE
jgi:xanthine dehydrogenase YagT iron-sulfur-binding subunit